MRGYFKKNAYSPVNRTQYIGAQRLPRETNQMQRRPNRQLRQPKSRKCDECGTAVSKWHRYFRIYQKRLCLGCYRKLSIKK